MSTTMIETYDIFNYPINSKYFKDLFTSLFLEVNNCSDITFCHDKYIKESRKNMQRELLKTCFFKNDAYAKVLRLDNFLYREDDKTIVIARVNEYKYKSMKPDYSLFIYEKDTQKELLVMSDTIKVMGSETDSYRIIKNNYETLLISKLDEKISITRYPNNIVYQNYFSFKPHEDALVRAVIKQEQADEKQYYVVEFENTAFDNFILQYDQIANFKLNNNVYKQLIQEFGEYKILSLLNETDVSKKLNHLESLLKSLSEIQFLTKDKSFTYISIHDLHMLALKKVETYDLQMTCISYDDFFTNTMYTKINDLIQKGHIPSVDMFFDFWDLLEKDQYKYNAILKKNDRKTRETSFNYF